MLAADPVSQADLYAGHGAAVPVKMLRDRDVALSFHFSDFVVEHNSLIAFFSTKIVGLDAILHVVGAALPYVGGPKH